MGTGGDEVGAGSKGMAETVILSIIPGYIVGSIEWQMRIGPLDP